MNRDPVPKLEVRDLAIAFGDREVVHLDRLELGQREILGMAGESGSGKSMTALAILGLAPTVGAKVRGTILFEGRDLLALSERELRDVGNLFVRTLLLHGAASKREARARAEEALRGVLLPPSLLARYPHQLSGGQAQRVAIALALALRSEVLLADEPTSALDVTVQAEILELIRRLRDDRGMSVLFISHDLAVVSELCDRIAVMRAGRTVEQGPARDLLSAPAEDYTKALVAAVPKVGLARPAQ